MTPKEPVIFPEIATANIDIHRLDPLIPDHAFFVRQDLFYFMMQEKLAALYPNFSEWYANKVIPGFVTSERLIHTALDRYEICGASIVKVTPDETKLCNLVVAQEKRNKGIGRKLLRQTLEVAHEVIITNGYSPEIIATVGEDIVTSSTNGDRSVLDFFAEFGFRVTDKLPDLYRKSAYEYILTATLD